MGLRDLSATIGLVAVIGLAYRIVSTWDVIGRLTRALGGSLLLILLAGSFGSLAYSHAKIDALTWVSVGIIVARAAALAVVLTWPWLAQHDESRARHRGGLSFTA